ncbi:MAG: glycosyltransferase [Bdellovibrionales bacterium]|nr:glycosyltransferase [Bdellovibrionales bacterium]
MRIRVFDYRANLGGGARFAVELCASLKELYPFLKFEIVSFGKALARYASLVEQYNLQIPVVAAPPTSICQRIIADSDSEGVRYAIGSLRGWGIEAPHEVVEDCDVAWFPWVHGHLLPQRAPEKVIASFHDVIPFQFPEIFSRIPTRVFVCEGRNVVDWMESGAPVILTSHATVDALQDVLGVKCKNPNIIRLSGDHRVLGPELSATVPFESKLKDPFLLYPANLTGHKNHEMLFRGVSLWGKKVPLLLTGEGTQALFKKFSWGRVRKLRSLALTLGFSLGDSLIPLGYVSTSNYERVLRSSWALIVPTLAEGGGSFPILEALRVGVPVLCSDIPVVREQIDFFGGDVIWFDPYSANDIGEKLDILFSDYERYRRRSEEQIPNLTRRSWLDVARDYARIIGI